ncbi:hypothetical protein MTR_4g113230 [Medicago truncatula]|uniref:Uncharacterized protein n=1 Tax=Medicago truncatula TaxID=3880 RepID=G7JU72_MEDTR|nr:hypothetical protein MTR_4g113230 [Medicago truncatula]
MLWSHPTASCYLLPLRRVNKTDLIGAEKKQLEANAVGNPNSANNGKCLIMLGCACKDELGIAHSHCAEACF